jgi:hypothetical protein
MKVYIAGPISGMAHYNYQAFANAQIEIEQIGFKAVNPHTICAGINVHDWPALLKKCTLVYCDAIYMLPGWQNSKGATLERTVAITLGIPIFYSIDALGEWQMMILHQLYLTKDNITPTKN